MDENASLDHAMLAKYDRPEPHPGCAWLPLPISGGFPAGAYRQAVQASNEDPVPRPLALRLHLPPMRRMPAGYLECLRREIALQGPLFDPDRTVEKLHLGGDAAARCPEAELAALMGELARHFHLRHDDSRDFSVRASLRTLTAERVHTLGQLGFNRAGLHVQISERFSGGTRVRGLAAELRAAGLLQLDLIVALPGAAHASIGLEAGLEQLLEQRPARVSLPVPGPGQSWHVFERACSHLAAGGYIHLGMGMFCRADDSFAQAQRQSRLRRNAYGYCGPSDYDLVGLGSGAVSEVGECYAENVQDPQAYCTRLAANRLATERGRVLTADDLLRRDVIDQLACQGRLEYALIEQRHHIAFQNYFSTELAALAPLAADGVLAVHRRRIELSPTGRLLMPLIAQVFARHGRENEHATLRRA